MGMLRDLRFEARILLKHPFAALVAIVTLGLGIGANTTIFSLVKAVVLNPLPGVANTRNLAVIGSRTFSGENIPFSYPNYVDIRDGNQVFASLAASAFTPISFSNGDRPQRIWGELVSGNYFQTFGANMYLGHPITPADDSTPGGSPVVVLSYEFWKSSLQSDSAIVGSKVLLNKHPFTVIGVAAPDYKGSVVGLSFQVFVPLMMEGQVYSQGSAAGDLLNQRNTQWLIVQGRLKPGVQLQGARANLDVLGQNLLKAYPNDQIAQRAVLFPLWRSPFGAQGYLLPAVSMLVVVGLLLLLLACVNVANVLLSLTSSRSGEMALRMSLGAQRNQLIRQFLSGSVLLTFAGAALSLPVAIFTSNLLANPPIPLSLPVSLNTSVDPLLLFFSLLLASGVGLLVGLVPAARVSSVRLAGVLRSDSGGQGSRRSGLAQVLVVPELAASLVLLSSAALMIGSIFHLRQSPPGFDNSHGLLAGIDLLSSGYDRASGEKLLSEILRSAKQQPGVQGATLTWQAQLAGVTSPSAEIGIQGYVPNKQENLIFHYNLVGPDYFHTAAIPLIAGRDFNEMDDLRSARVAVVNRMLADRFWPGQNPIGRMISAKGDSYRVIGVAQNAKYISIAEDPQPFVYLPFLQNYQPQATVLIQTTGNPIALSDSLRQVIGKLDPGLSVLGVETVERQVASTMAGFQTIAVLLAMAGLIGIMLAAIGVYGIVAQSVVRRRQEIGIRAALGATPRVVAVAILWKTFRLAAVGVILGAVLSVLSAQGLRRAFHGISDLNPLFFVIPALGLMLIIATACWIPASHASRLDPSSILREQ